MRTRCLPHVLLLRALLGLRALGKEVEMAEASFGEEGGLGEMGTEVCAPHS